MLNIQGSIHVSSTIQMNQLPAPSKGCRIGSLRDGDFTPFRNHLAPKITPNPPPAGCVEAFAGRRAVGHHGWRIHGWGGTAHEFWTKHEDSPPKKWMTIRWWFHYTNIYCVFFFGCTSGKIPSLTNIFRMGGNHQLDDAWSFLFPFGTFSGAGLFVFRDAILLMVELASSNEGW